MRLAEIVIVALLAVALIACPRRAGDDVVSVVSRVDTVVVRDTIRMPVPEPYAVVVRDTVFVTVPVVAGGGEVSVEVPLVVEEKEYRTPDYYAMVRGVAPELVRLELFPETRYVSDVRTITVSRKPKWGVGVQAGYGIGRGGPSPYIGVGLQYNIFTF